MSANAAAAEPEAAAAPARSSRWRRRLAIAAVVLVVLAVAFRAALPYALERAVPPAAERFGFAASVENIDFAVLRGHVTVEGLSVSPLAPTSAGVAAPRLFGLGRLFANLEWLRLLSGDVELAELLLEKPDLALVRATDGYIELPALPPSTEPKPAVQEEPGEPLPVLVKVLSIEDTSFHLLDGGGGADLVDFTLREFALSDLLLEGAKVGLGGIRISEPTLKVRREVQATRAGTRRGAASAPVAEAGGAPPEVRIEDLDIERAEFTVLTDDGEPVSVVLDLKTSGVSLAPDAPFPFEMRVEARGGFIAVAGQLGLNPVVWDGKVGWDGLRVPMFVRVGLPGLIPWIRSCSASGELQAKYRLGRLRASGQFGIDDFAMEDPDQELALGWQQLAIEVKEADFPLGGGSEPIKIALGKVTLAKPTARYVLPNTAVERLAASTGGASDAATDVAAPPAPGAIEVEPATPPEAKPAAPEPRITVDRIEVRGGSAEFIDRAENPAYQGRVRDLTVDVTGVKLPERSVRTLRVRGLAPDRAPFDLQAALPGATGTLTFKLERLPLAQFTPYAARAADLRIPQGELSLDTKASLAKQGAAGKVETSVVVHQLALKGGPNAISIAGMPLDLALALLRDPQGDIRLPVPVEYGEQGASAGLGAIVVGALQAALTGAVTSPIKAVGALLPEGGGGEISFDPIPFAPGSADAPADAGERLDPLAKLLAARPGLGLALVGSAGPDDRLALAERVLIERVSSDQDLPELSEAGFFARRRVRGALEARGSGEAGALEAEDEALLARYLEATDVPAARYTELAERRAEALRGLVTTAHALPPARVAAEAAAGPGAPAVALELRVGGSEGAAAAP